MENTWEKDVFMSKLKIPNMKCLKANLHLPGKIMERIIIIRLFMLGNVLILNCSIKE